MRSHQIVSIEKRPVFESQRSGWSLLVEYAGKNDEGSKGKAGGQPKTDWRAILSSEEYSMFNELRDLRKKLAEEKAIPVYAVFTNDQLVQIVRSMPQSSGQLMEIQGVGESKVRDYGDQIITWVQSQGTKSEADEKGTDEKGQELSF